MLWYALRLSFRETRFFSLKWFIICKQLAAFSSQSIRTLAMFVGQISSQQNKAIKAFACSTPLAVVVVFPTVTFLVWLLRSHHPSSGFSRPRVRTWEAMSACHEHSHTHTHSNLYAMCYVRYLITKRSQQTFNTTTSFCGDNVNVIYELGSHHVHFHAHSLLSGAFNNIFCISAQQRVQRQKCEMTMTI